MNDYNVQLAKLSLAAPGEVKADAALLRRAEDTVLLSKVTTFEAHLARCLRPGRTTSASKLKSYMTKYSDINPATVEKRIWAMVQEKIG